MNTQRRGTTPPHNRVGVVTNSLRVESPGTSNDFFGGPRRAGVERGLAMESGWLSLVRTCLARHAARHSGSELSGTGLSCSDLPRLLPGLKGRGQERGSMAKEICISTTPHETRLAILEDEQLTEIYYERENEYTLAGSIYKGKVTRVLPGMQSAFVDLGLERDAFLYVTDFLEEQEDSEEFTEAPGDGQEGAS